MCNELSALRLKKYKIGSCWQDYHLLWTDLCPPKFVYWNSNLQCDSIWRWGLWNAMRVRWVHEGGALVIRLRDPIEQHSPRPHTTHQGKATWGHSKKATRWLSAIQKESPGQKQKGLSPWSWTCQPPELWENYFLLFKAPSDISLWKSQ